MFWAFVRFEFAFPALLARRLLRLFLRLLALALLALLPFSLVALSATSLVLSLPFCNGFVSTGVCTENPVDTSSAEKLYGATA